MRIFKLFLIAVLFTVPTAYTEAATLKIATMSPPGGAWMQRFEKAAKDVNQKTDGRVAFKFYPGGVMGNDKTVLRKINLGQLQGGAITIGSLMDAYPDIALYSTFFKFRNQAEVDAVRPILDVALQKGLEEKGFISFGLAGGGFAYLLSNQPIYVPEDLRGRKVWVPETDPKSAQMLVSMGLSTVPLGLGDVLTALQTGMVDTVANSPVGAIALQWHTGVKYMTKYPLIYIAAIMAVDKKSFDKLTPEDQTIVRQAMTAAFQDIDQQNRKDNDGALAALKNQGITVIEPTAAQAAEWYKTAADVDGKSKTLYGFSTALIEKLNAALATYRAQYAAK